ncbi:hypothetical protein UFOVP328_397 [uncultured Caudovirales phage]|uniref:Uncharacterized protein n=1 Tax=uncultured Caudovirales phage TaxID=2100421 RepID=A0A6J5LUI3_9CAUD|nr:hypothetical protein UFOVP328_397 [uncultured Caudovirales phage]
MATHAVNTYCIDQFWDDEFKHLDYVQEPFNDPADVAVWLSQGYQSKICGDLCDMRHRLPSWNQRFIDFYQDLGWKDIGCAYYRMTSGTVMPVHQDRYKRYIEVFDLQGQEHNIVRAVVMLESWSPGHYIEVMGQAHVGYPVGQVFEWTYDTPHMAANIGLEPRYTLQITGHL